MEKGILKCYFSLYLYKTRVCNIFVIFGMFLYLGRQIHLSVVFLYGWEYTIHRPKVVSAATSIPYGRKNNRFSLFLSVFNKFKLIKLFRCGILTSCYNAFVGNWVRLHCWEVKERKKGHVVCVGTTTKKCLVYFVWSFNLSNMYNKILDASNV